jgi:cytochrome P450
MVEVALQAKAIPGREDERVTDTTIDQDALLLEILMTPEGKADPYPRYEAIRERSAVFESSLGALVVSRYEDCNWVLREPKLGRGPQGNPWEQYGLTEAEWRERFPRRTGDTTTLLLMDPPDHTRLRKLVVKAFTARNVEKMRPDVARLTDDLIADFDGEVDVMSALALELPITVIGEMLGVPESMRGELQPLIRSTVATLEFMPSLEAMDEAAAAIEQVIARFEDLITERRSSPTDDLLSMLIHVEEEGDQLSHEELLSTILLLFAAGFETTTNLIGNGLLAFLDHPDQLAKLRADRSLMATAVEELLRWDSPVQLNDRAALEPVEFHGRQLEPGQHIITLLGAANRDGRMYPEPDTFDITRETVQPMSFGGGIHYCLGASLARLEGQVVFDRLLERFTTIEPAWGDERPKYRDSIVLRGLETLPVDFA